MSCDGSLEERKLVQQSLFVITQAFAGHLGDLELAAISIVGNVIVGFDFGLLLGMASALETLCGQAFGAKKYYMLGVYMQLSRIVLSVCCVLLLPLYLFASPVLKLLGQTKELSELSGMQLGVVVTAASLNISWWVLVFGLYGYVICGGCPLTWTGFSMEAFSGLWEFVKLSAASGVRLCTTINGWELMIPLAFFAGTREQVVMKIIKSESVPGELIQMMSSRQHQLHHILRLQHRHTTVATLKPNLGQEPPQLVRRHVGPSLTVLHERRIDVLRRVHLCDPELPGETHTFYNSP
ncbi:hypothetical protein QYF36_000655 [Acer negundo]|nr:hypothetical protein QYF36_000655 [Acer negundo]